MKTILHIDMNSYFASVEQQANPFLRGRPVGVCSYLSPGGCIIASSAEAKAKGIKTGCRASEALELDPDVVLLENDPDKYRATTEAIFAILREYTDMVEPYSIDEAFLDLSGCPHPPPPSPSLERGRRKALSVKLPPRVRGGLGRGNSDSGMGWGGGLIIAQEIQQRIKNEVGEWLNCSIGISWTKWLAKFAGDIAPKRGILTIGSQEELIKILDNRGLTDAWGINAAMAARLHTLGIRNLLELRNFDQFKIKRALGRYGYYLWANVNGIEIDMVNNGSRQAKSIGHSYCLPKKTTDKDYLRQVLYKLCEKTGRRLRGQGLEASLMRSGFSYEHWGGAWKSFKTSAKMYSTDEIYAQAVKVLDETKLIMPVRMMAVSVGSLCPLSGQLSLFKDRSKTNDLSLAMDRINDKYGEYTVVRGRMFGTADLARDRIGFRRSN